MSVAAHIALAQTEGAKAGFKAYMATRVHTAAKRQAEIRSAGNSKAQFVAYCGIFGSQFAPVSGEGAVRAEAQREDVRESVTAKLRKAAELLGLTVVDNVPVVEPVVEDEPEDEPIIATRISWPMAMVLKKAVEKKGKTFKIQSKTGGKGTGQPANYAIKVAGKLVTPAQASALIGASRAEASAEAAIAEASRA